jgi:outer membrane translocation and assembly module TamA
MLGGGTTVRGWRPDFAGPFLQDSAPQTLLTVAESSGLDPSDLTPIGGEAMSYGNLEVRKDLPGGFGVVAFLDVGMAWDQLDDVNPNDLIPSIGLGFRYRSPVGPARLDLARLLDDDLFMPRHRWNIHFALAEAF